MALVDYLVPLHGYSNANLCFRCQKACGGCSWSELDPVTRKPRFEPVPGWTAKKILLNVGRSRKKRHIIETYHITACPEFVPDEERHVERVSITDEQFEKLMKEWRIWGWF